jgi:outer membrane immunogenic protein
VDFNARLLLGSVALVAVAASPALASDLNSPAAPIYTKAPAMAPLYDWTGFYIGGHAADSWTHSDGQTMNTANGRLFTPSSNNMSGFHGGGQIGYDYMLPSRIVLGIVATVSSGSHNSSTNVGFNEISTSEGKTDVSGNVRGQLGYAFDTWLLYGTGGWAWTHGSSTRTQVTGMVGNAVPGTVETASTSNSGWTVGAGLDYAFARNWDVFAEYRYAPPRSLTITFPIAQRSTSITSTSNVIEAGINWRFNWGGPIGARY